MATPSMIWVLVRSTEVRDRFLSFVDAGNYKEALDLKGSLEGMVNALRSFIQQYGAGCPIACDDVVAMKIPVTLARNLDSLLESYLRDMPGMAVGVGFNFFEAASACKKSKKTRKIELYEKTNGEPLIRAEPLIHKPTDPEVSIPPNLFDPETPSDTQYLAQLQEPSVVDMPGFQKEVDAESKYIQILASQMGAPSDQEIQQAQAQQQAAQQQAQGGTVSQSGNPNAKSMLAALGKNPPNPNDKDEDGEDKEDSGKTLRDAKKSKDDDKPKKSSDDSKKPKSSKDDSGESDESEEDLKGEIEEAEASAKKDHNKILYDQLDRIKADLPQIMGLAQKDPAAFKQSMQMVGKLLEVAKRVQKNEIQIETIEDLEKAVELNLPVGTRKDMKKKVAVSGKPDVWRSMKTGQLKDQDDGSPISVRQFNSKVKQKTDN